MRKAELRVLTGDLFDITGRLRAIDADYFVAYNGRLHRYEVHHRRQRGGTFCLAVPYDRLDARTVTLVRRTRAERAAKLLKEYERDNRRASDLQLKAAVAAAEKDWDRRLRTASQP